MQILKIFLGGGNITNVAHVKGEILYNYYQMINFLCYTQSQQSFKIIKAEDT